MSVDTACVSQQKRRFSSRNYIECLSASFIGCRRHSCALIATSNSQQQQRFEQKTKTDLLLQNCSCQAATSSDSW